MRRGNLLEKLTDPYLLIPVGLAIWYTILCGGFAYLYWFHGFIDPRNIFGDTLSHIGAILVFPVGWIGLLFSIEP